MQYINDGSAYARVSITANTHNIFFAISLTLNSISAMCLYLDFRKIIVLLQFAVVVVGRVLS